MQWEHVTLVMLSVSQFKESTCELDSSLQLNYSGRVTLVLVIDMHYPHKQYYSTTVTPEGVRKMKIRGCCFTKTLLQPYQSEICLVHLTHAAHKVDKNFSLAPQKDKKCIFIPSHVVVSVYRTHSFVKHKKRYFK